MSNNSGKLFATFFSVLLCFYVSWHYIRLGNTRNTKYRIKFEIPELEYLTEVDALIFLREKKGKEKEN